MKRKFGAMFAVLALLLAGCPSEKNFRDGIAAFHGFLIQAQDHHETECRAAPTKTLCVSINKAGDALNIARAALKVYCSGTPKAGDQPFLQGGPCVVDKSAEPRMQAAFSELQKLLPVIKDLGK